MPVVNEPVAGGARAAADADAAAAADAADAAGMPRPPGAGDALLLVDVQRDFLPGGALPAPAGPRVVAPLNQCIAAFEARALPVVASRDWHPAAHDSFRAQGGPWPPHAVAGTGGARFAAGLRVPAGAIVVDKGTEPSGDAYSAFDGTGLGARLRGLGVRRVVVGGLTTEWCVDRSVRDALAAGFEVLVLQDAVASVEARPGDGERALAALRAAGAGLVDSARWLGAAAEGGATAAG